MTLCFIFTLLSHLVASWRQFDGDNLTDALSWHFFLAHKRLMKIYVAIITMLQCFFTSMLGQMQFWPRSRQKTLLYMTSKFLEYLGKEQREELNGHWPTEGDTREWYRLPRTEREMTMSSGIASVRSPVNFAKVLLEGMLRQVRKISGDKDLSSENFLNISTVSSTYKHILDVWTLPPALAKARSESQQRL